MYYTHGVPIILSGIQPILLPERRKREKRWARQWPKRVICRLPMRWARERRRQFGFGIALGCIQLGLDEKETLAEIGPSEVGISQVGSSEVGHSQVGTAQVSSKEVCP